MEYGVVSKRDTLKIENIGFKSAIFVLYGYKTCTGCKESLNQFLCSIKSDSIKCYGLYRAFYGSSQYWEILSGLNNHCEKYTDLFFDLSSSTKWDDLCRNNDGLFYLLKVERTPTLLFIDKLAHKTTYISYEDLFDGMVLKASAKKLIKGIIK